MQPKHSLLTVVIVAKKPESLIDRCLKSAIEHSNCKVLIIDAKAGGNEISLAECMQRSRVQICVFREQLDPSSLREFAVSKVSDPYLMWLEPEDELVEGSVDRAIVALESGADVVFDPMEIADRKTGDVISESSIAPFLSESAGLVRNFETDFFRNHRHFSARTGFSWKVGFDQTVDAAWISDFVLNAIELGGSFKFLKEPGSRTFCLDGDPELLNFDSESLFLKKHSYEKVRSFYEEAGFGNKIIFWALTLFAVRRNDYDKALQFIEFFQDDMDERNPISSALDPFPQGADWKYAFMKGTILLLQGHAQDALSWLRRATETNLYFEGLNNCGVAHRMLGELEMANACFEIAVRGNSNYQDAIRNLENEESLQISKCPMVISEQRVDSV